MQASIQHFSSKGYGVADGVEIAHTVPGDQILFELTRKKRLPQKGRLLEVVTPSIDRVKPLCSHAQICGGCCWQQMSYEAQLREKQARVEMAFGFAARPIIPCDQQYHYRNKMEFSFSENRGGQKFLGLMIAQAEPYVFNVEECHLVNPWFSKALCAVRKWWEGSGVKAYFPPSDEGSLRYLTLREAMRTGEKMAVLNVSGNPAFALNRQEIDSFVAVLKEAVSDDLSIFLRIHQTKKGRPTHFFEMHCSGKDHIMEQLHLQGGVLSFKISPISFFQPNTLAAEKLYDAALALLPQCSIVYDLYCGTGTLGMAAARHAHQVIGIELSPEAVIDAKANALHNGLSNVTIHQGDVGQVITQLMGSSNFIRPDAVIVDPPRAGLDALALHHLKTLWPKTIIYISCNPKTQAENVKELQNAGYQLQLLQPLDQFPHTYHIENIALLQRA